MRVRDHDPFRRHGRHQREAGQLLPPEATLRHQPAHRVAHQNRRAPDGADRGSDIVGVVSEAVPVEVPASFAAAMASEAERVGRVAPVRHEVQDVLGPHPGAREGPMQEEQGRLGRGRGRQRPLDL